MGYGLDHGFTIRPPRREPKTGYEIVAAQHLGQKLVQRSVEQIIPLRYDDYSIAKENARNTKPVGSLEQLHCDPR
jgi:hypothetical protein